MSIAAAPPPPRTPSPRIHIRGSSFPDSPPSSHPSITTSLEPFSKSTGTPACHDLACPTLLRPLHTKMSDESMSDASSASSGTSSSISGVGDDDADDEGDGEPLSSPPRLPRRRYRRLDRHARSALPKRNLMGLFAAHASPHRSHSPLHHARSGIPPPAPMPPSAAGADSPPPPPVASAVAAVIPTSATPTADPFAFQDPAFPMYAPFLVRVVLDLYDVRGLSWQNIAENVERIWGFRTCSAEVLGVLSSNGRVGGRRWWD